jgi:hypothetical protein
MATFLEDADESKEPVGDPLPASAPANLVCLDTLVILSVPNLFLHQESAIEATVSMDVDPGAFSWYFIDFFVLLFIRRSST